MSTATIRENLHQYIDQSDDKLLKLMLALAKEYNEEDVLDEFTAEDIQQFDERKRKWLNGESEAFEWKDAKQIYSSSI